MPQDGRKSVRYRPFVTCNDPKGVIECGTIRKSKISSYQKMEPNIKCKNPNKSPDHGEGHASFQLSEVSKGAQKLNHMIDTWSKSLNSEGQPKDLAKDLLKGAIDLQESLMMLGKLQAASKYVSKLKKKQEKGNDNGGTKPEKARVFKEEKIEELKEMIRSSFERQNLLRSVNGGRGHFGKFNPEPEFPSTSSSHSSSSYNDRINERLGKKANKGPGIIAKLMGLEEISSKPMMIHKKQPLQLFSTDMQMPKLKDREIRERKTLKEVLDTMHLKGLLKGNSVKAGRILNDSDFDNDMPPIVIIKPLQIPSPKNDAVDEVKDMKVCEVEESTYERRSIKCKDEVGELEKEEIKGEVSGKVKASAPLNRKPLRKEATNKKLRENGKVNKNDRRSSDKGTLKRQPQNLAKKDVSQKGRENGGPNPNRVKKEESEQQRNEVRKESPSRAQKDHKSIRKKVQKTMKEPKETKLTKLAKGNALPLLRKEDERKIDTSSEIDVQIDINNINMDQQSVEVNSDGSESRVSEQHDAKNEPSTCSTVKGYDYDNRRFLLLSSQSFLARAEDLFTFISNPPTILEKPKDSDSQPPYNERLYIDCATELIERKSLHATPLGSSICNSMEKLVEEVCDGIEILSNYWSNESDISPSDGLYAMLKSDLHQNRGMVGSKLWDMGWSRGFSSDDAEEVVIELEEIILSRLIDELFRG